MRRKAGVIKAESATADDESQTHELTGIEVREVSVVDRPANKRKFLLVKRDASATQEDSGSGMKLQATKKADLLKTMKGLQDAAALIAKAVEGAEVADGAETPSDLQKALEGISNLAATLTPPATPPAADPAPVADPAPTTKAGRKMSAARSAKLQQASGLLMELLTEISGASATAEVTDDDAPADDAPAKKAAATAPPAAPVPVSDPAVTSALKDLTDGMASLTKAMKIQKERLDTIASGSAGSQQVRTDKSEHERASEAKPVAWPLDMNRPITKANTPAEKSFFD